MPLLDRIVDIAGRDDSGGAERRHARVVGMKSIVTPRARHLVVSSVVAASTVALLLVHPGVDDVDVRAQSAVPDRWVATWTTAEVGRPQNPAPPPALQPLITNARCPAPPAPPASPSAGQPLAPPPYLQLTNQTLRQIVHTSIGGSRARVVLSNAYGTAPVTIGAAHIALREVQGAIQAASDRSLTFSGRPTITIPANAVAYSDPVNLVVPQMSDVAIDLYLPGTTNTPASLTMHGGAFQTSYISETGNYVGKPTLPEVGTTQSWFLLSRVDVVAPDAAGVVVAFGDSITDGTRSTPNTNNRWPDHLARRLLAQGMKMAVAQCRHRRESACWAKRRCRRHRHARRWRRHQRAGPLRASRALRSGRDARHRARRHQRHRQRAAEPDADGRGPHRRRTSSSSSRVTRAGSEIIGATLTPFWGAGYYTEVGEA